MDRTEYKIVEYNNIYHCVVYKNDNLYGCVYSFKTLEEVFAWLRLMFGAYPGTFEKGA